jgi:hypothetical protein
MGVGTPDKEALTISTLVCAGAKAPDDWAHSKNWRFVE